MKREIDSKRWLVLVGVEEHPSRPDCASHREARSVRSDVSKKQQRGSKGEAT